MATVMTIPKLFIQESEYWTKANQKFFGVTPIEENDNFIDIQKKLDEDCAKYWNTTIPCKLAQYLNSGRLNPEIKKQTPMSYKLHLNPISMCIDIKALYDNKLLIIGAMPTPCNDLTWIIKKTHYVTRITATKDMNLVHKPDFEHVECYGWQYNIKTQEFTCTSLDKTTGLPRFEATKEEIYNNHLSNRSRICLEHAIGQPLTIDNFCESLKKLKIFENNSIYRYKFYRIEFFEEAILNSAKFAQPTKKIYLDIAGIISNKKKHTVINGEAFDGCLVRSESKIFALENFRTCVNIFGDANNNKKNFRKYVRNKKRSSSNKKNDGSNSKFIYSDINGFFDSFKTVTSKSAGRQRLLLDNVVVNDGMLWVVDEKHKEHNMYEYILDPPRDRLSCLSKAPFCNNDKPKRIMMNAKMTSQAVPLNNELDDLTHRIIARVAFTDLEGYTTADSIIISESFAKKLRTFSKDIIYCDISSNIYEMLHRIYTDDSNPDNIIDIETLYKLYPTKNKAIILSYERAKIDRVDLTTDSKRVRVFISWEIPFRLGDKITNLHGAKGTVGLILPDNKMPKLLNKVGKMKAGPIEVVISGFSTIRRGSLGQIFEAWALASGIKIDGEDFIANMIDKYIDQMQEYSNNSVVEYNGIQKIVPVGYNYIMRLYHHASTKVSCSSAEHGYTRTLRFGEMEKFNLIANDCPNILKELGIRSIVKYIGSHKLVTDMEETRELPKNPRLNMSFLEILKSMGYEVTHEDDKSDVEYVPDTSNDEDEYYLMDDEDDELDPIDIANLNNIVKGVITNNNDYEYGSEEDDEDDECENDEEYFDEDEYTSYEDYGESEE